MNNVFKNKKITPEFIKWWEDHYGSGRREFYIVKRFHVWFEDMSFSEGSSLVWFREMVNGEVQNHTYFTLGSTEQEIISNTYHNLRLYNCKHLIPSVLETYLDELKIRSNEKKD